MLYFLVWEIYSADWILVKKGNVFLRLEEGQDIDSQVLLTEMGIAEANNVSRRQCVVTSIQPGGFLMYIVRADRRRSFRCEPATAAKPRCMI